jgi:hypothetical protein
MFLRTKLFSCLQHMLNPLHIYCRIMDIKIGKFSINRHRARKLCSWYEKSIYSIIIRSIRRINLCKLMVCVKRH